MKSTTFLLPSIFLLAFLILPSSTQKVSTKRWMIFKRLKGKNQHYEVLTFAYTWVSVQLWLFHHQALAFVMAWIWNTFQYLYIKNMYNFSGLRYSKFLCPGPGWESTEAGSWLPEQDLCWLPGQLRWVWQVSPVQGGAESLRQGGQEAVFWVRHALRYNT